MNNNMPFMYPNSFEGTINWGINNEKILETKVSNLEKEINMLKNRVTKLENQTNNYSNNYQPNSYNMM